VKEGGREGGREECKRNEFKPGWCRKSKEGEEDEVR
jgi:hypothetical protein